MPLLSVERDRHAIRVRAAGASQHGLVTWQQLQTLGVPERTVTAWIDRRVLVRVLPRVYSIDHRPATVERDLCAALLYAGPGAMLSHATAAWWRGLIKHHPRGPVEVCTPRQVQSIDGLRVHGRHNLERALHRGLAVTTTPQTVLGLAATQEQRLVRRALAVLDYRGQLDLPALESLCGQGRAGSTSLRQALIIHQPRLARTNGPLEEDFLVWCERYRLPLPQVNVEVHGVLVDAYWAADALVVELDGGANHYSRGQRRVDKRKELTLREHGIRVVRYDWDLIHDEPARVHTDLRAQLPRSLLANRQKTAG